MVVKNLREKDNDINQTIGTGLCPLESPTTALWALAEPLILILIGLMTGPCIIKYMDNYVSVQ